jgi:hypothetical protein
MNMKNYRWLALAILSLLAVTPVSAASGDYVPKDYVWTTESHNSSESMPCGGHDIGMNVWVEKGDVLFYVSRSGMFDENNTLLKAGRFRLHFKNNGNTNFKQILHLDDGSVEISCGNVRLRLWADVFSPVIFADVRAGKPTDITLSYESWRHHDRAVVESECHQTSFRLSPKDCGPTRHDMFVPKDNSLLFYHQNQPKTVFDFTVHHEYLDSIKQQLYNPVGGLTFGGWLLAPGFKYVGTTDGTYSTTDYRAWNYSCAAARHAVITIPLFIVQNAPIPRPEVPSMALSRKRSARWWHAFWQRSYIIADSGEAQHIARNYELFRYMLGCNAYGEWPTKFNGGLFTFDPVYVDDNTPFTPDFRRWGGGTMTAQNQRLVYWPMLKSGDEDMMASQFDTYLRMLPSAVARTHAYWGHDGACFTEQIDNCGLPNPSEYSSVCDPACGDKGVERNRYLEYLWDTSLEFCSMILQAHDYAGLDISRYDPLIRECLQFFDAHYRYLAKQRGCEELDGNGKLILYPGSGCETIKMAYNSASTIAALQTVLKEWGKDSLMLSRIPDIPLRVVNGDTCIAPAITWARYNNAETPQLYPVFPWRVYGLGRPGLDIARNTYLKDPFAVKTRSSKGWKQNNIWAACLGLTDEATRLAKEKFRDGPFRFPAFWEHGYDWAPDCNRGGSAMIGLQEMLLQENPDGTLLLFPAWPKEWNVRFRLHATKGRIVEAEMRDGKIIQ